MKIKVEIFSGGAQEQDMEVSPDSTYGDMLGCLKINPEIVLVFRNGTPVPLDEKVSGGDVKILRVVTGG